VLVFSELPEVNQFQQTHHHSDTSGGLSCVFLLTERDHSEREACKGSTKTLTTDWRSRAVSAQMRFAKKLYLNSYRCLDISPIRSMCIVYSLEYIEKNI
jgi:hypothetical protein